MKIANPVFALDTHGILSYLLREPGGPAVKEKLSMALHGDCRVLISAMSFGETAYIIERRKGIEAAADSLALLEELPVRIVELDRQAVLSAARIKAQHPISFGDAFVVALALDQGATVMTGDPEFKRVEHLVPVFWLSQRESGG